MSAGATLYTWGRNNQAQLGLGSQEEYFAEPQEVQFPGGTPMAIGLGWYHGVAVVGVWGVVGQGSV